MRSVLKIVFAFYSIIHLSSCISRPVNWAGPGSEEPLLPVISKSRITDTQEYNVVLLKEDPTLIWQRIATPENMEKYKAVNGRTKCNIFLGDMMTGHFGEDVHKKVFPRGMMSPDQLYHSWKTNSNLVRLYPDEFSIADIQEMANKGYLIILAYHYNLGPDHVAFVGNTGLELKTIPPLARLEGKAGSSIGRDWLPIVVQAGTYSGITSMVYASNGWLRSDLFKNGTVCYYLIIES